MAIACPHCKVEIADVLTQATHVERLNLKEAANEALRGEKAALEAKVTRLAPFEAQVATLTADLEKQKGSSAKVLAAAKAGLNPDKMRLVETAYEMSFDGTDASRRPAFADWLVADDGAKANGDIKHLFAGVAPTTPGAPVPKSDAPPPGSPPPGGARPTPQQLSAYFASPEFKSLPRDQQKAKVAELEAQTKTAPGQDGRA